MARKERTTMFIHRVHSEISILQNPEDCTLARLLLVDYEAEALRSVEAFLIRLSSALAEAFFSNRTLLLGPTPFFPNQPIRACGASGSLHECFFLPLSRCSVDDLREEELYQLSVSTRAARPPNSSVKSSPGMTEWISELSFCSAQDTMTLHAPSGPSRDERFLHYLQRMTVPVGHRSAPPPPPPPPPGLDFR